MATSVMVWYSSVNLIAALRSAYFNYRFYLVDVTVYHNSFHGDLNETFLVGNVKPEVKKLVEVTYECLSKAIDIVKPGRKYREIGNVIQKHAQAHGFSVVRSYCGHGIHRLFHTAPNVPHYASKYFSRVNSNGKLYLLHQIVSNRLLY